MTQANEPPEFPGRFNIMKILTDAPLVDMRRNLIVVRAGSKALHYQWTLPDDRQWDLITLAYTDTMFGEAGVPPGITVGDWIVDNRAASAKFYGIHAFFEQHPEALGYESIMMPDDDLLFDPALINDLFALFKESGAALGQPSLSWDSCFSHYVTLHNPAFRYRRTNFAEVMAPIMTGSTVRDLLPTFLGSRSAWGLDLLWAKLCEDRGQSVVVLDQVPVRHTRPVGGGDHYAAPQIHPAEEAQQLLAEYKVQPRATQVLGAVLNPQFSAPRSGLLLESFLSGVTPALSQHPGLIQLLQASLPHLCRPVIDEQQGKAAERLFKTSSSIADGLVNRSVELWKAGDSEQAIALLRQARYLAPTHSAVNQVLCQALLQQGIDRTHKGEIDGAIAVLREAERLQPEYPNVQRTLGIILLNKANSHLQNNQLALAEALLHEAERLLPEEIAPKHLLVQLLIRNAIGHAQAERQVEAVEILRESVQLAPGDAIVLDLFWQLTFQVGLTEEAAVTIRQLVALSPDNADYAGCACLTLHALGDVAAAEAHARRFVNLIKAGRQVTKVNPGEVLRILGEILIARQQHEQSITLFIDLAQSGFDKTVCATVVADTLLATGSVEQALAVISPFAASNWSRTFITASIAQFRDTLRRTGSELPSRRASDYDAAHAVSISSLGSYGRFGHQMWEYLSLYLYVRQNALVLETPDWVGHYFFELDEPIQQPYRHVVRHGQRRLLRRNMLGVDAIIVANVDIWSPGPPWDNWKPGTPMLSIAQRDIVQQRLKVRSQWLPYLQPALDKLDAFGRTIVAIHLRRGDRVAMNDITPTLLYQDWLTQLWPTLDRPVLFLASDDIDVVKQDFAVYRPYLLSDLAESWCNNEYLQDFFILMNCDILAISTGSFAASAALLNRRARLFVSPSPDNRSIIAFDPYMAD